MRRASWLLQVLPLSLLGCADMLGLGGLTYDQGVDEVVQASGGTAASTGGDNGIYIGDGDALSEGGAAGTTEFEGYSVLLDRGARIAASPISRQGPLYFVYEPGEETLTARVQGWEDAELVDSWTLLTPHQRLTHLLVVPYDLGLTLFAYDAVSGFFSQSTFEDGEYELLHSDYGNDSRTFVIPFFTGADWRVYSYEKESGTVRHFRPRPAEDPELYVGASEPGWTSIGRFELNGEHGVIKHDSETGKLQFDRFVAGEEAFEVVLETTLYGNYSSVIPFHRVTATPTQELLLYRETTGNVARASLVHDETGTRMLIHEEGAFREDLAIIEPLMGFEPPQALTFSSTSGRLVLRDLYPLEELDNTVIR